MKTLLLGWQHLKIIEKLAIIASILTACLISYMSVLSGNPATSVLALIKREKRTFLMFAIVPMVLYAIINIPFLSLFAQYLTESGLEYPSEIGDPMLRILSKSGDLVSLMTFSNNWLYNDEWIGNIENPAFIGTSLAIFIAMFSVFASAYNRMKIDDKVMALVFLGAILVSMFIAQGMNNSILQYIVGIISDAGLRDIIGPFREWARMSIMIPVFMVALLSFSLPSLKKAKVAVIVLGAIIAVNLVTDYSDFHFNRYMPLHIGDTYDKLADLVPQEARIVWIDYKDKIPATTIDGRYRSIGRPDSAEIGSPCKPNGYEKMFKSGELDFSTVKSHHIDYFVLDARAEVPYEWLSCERVDYLKLCSTGVGSRRFSAYESIQAAETVEEETAQIEYTQIDPGRWIVMMDGSDPFMFVFAEKYLPGWEARIFKDGELVSTARSVPIAESINGFWIEESGELEIRVVYAPQKNFEAFLIVSAAGILACFTMMFVGDRR